MSRIQILLLCTCLVVMTSGCRNRCNDPCGGGWFAGNSRVAPPPTYSLNIPSVAKNQPYYTPGSAAPNYTLNPNQNAPTPTNQSGWRQSGNQLSNGANGGDAAPGDSRSVLTNPTTFVETQPNNINRSGIAGNQPTRTAALPGTGQSYRDSANYRTTQIDERRDATRLPVTDASTVRAPAMYYPNGGVVQFQQPNPNYPANYNRLPQQTFVNQNGRYQQPSAYNGSTYLVGGQPSAYQGQAVLVNPAGYVNPAGFVNPYPTSSAPSVLAQSTTSPGQGNAGQVGWRTREMNSDNVNRF